MEESSPVNRRRGTTGHHTVRISIFFDSFVWVLIEDQVRRIQLELIPEQQEAVQRRRCAKKLRNAAQNVLKRAKACMEASGGHFEHYL